MKATDLMIGDLLLHKGQPIKVEETLIDGINPMWDGSENYGNEAYYEDLQPIPLTPEILEKNGWELTKTASSKHYWHDDVPFHIPIEPYHHWRGDEDRIFADDFFDSVFIRLGYVHELQHALKLCRIEKEIVL